MSIHHVSHHNTETSPVTTPIKPPRKTYDLVVSLGTDHHKFSRLLRWVDAYLEQNPRVSALIQHGHTDPISRGDNVKLVSVGELLEYYSTASVVLVQGGPGSIQDARRTGAIPLTVPRRAEFNEVVDNHQVPFTDLMQKNGHVIAVDNREDLFDKLNLALDNPSLMRSAKPYTTESEISAEQLSKALAALLSGHKNRTEGYLRRFKNAFAAHRAGKAEMDRINAITPHE